MKDTTSYIRGLKAAKGFVLGIVAAVSYGTNPLFAVPLYSAGYTVDSVLFYRYAIASLILASIMLVRGISFRLSRHELFGMVIMGILFALSSQFLFVAYQYMDVGLASTLLFVEPAIIVLILWIVFKEHIRGSVIISIVVCLCGVGCLCNPGEGAYVTTKGVVFVLLSSLSYAIYMVAINKSRIRYVSSTRIAFYSLLFGMIVFVFTTSFFTKVQPIDFAAPTVWGCIIGLSVVPTIISLLTVAISVKYVGSVTVAILGAFEPVTGILVGCLLFDEILTPRAVLGIILILTSVIVIIKTHHKQ